MTLAFWCDLLDLPPPRHRHVDVNRDVLPLLPLLPLQQDRQQTKSSRHERLLFCERSFLDAPNTRNVLLVNAVHRSLTGGLDAPRDRILAPAFSARRNDDDGQPITHLAALTHVLRSTNLSYRVTGASVEASRRAYDDALRNMTGKGGWRHVKRELLRRISRRYLLDDERVFSDALEDLPLPEAYAAMLSVGECDKTSHIPSRLPAAPLDSADALSERIRRGLSCPRPHHLDDDRHERTAATTGTTMTAYEYCVCVLTRDGNFVRRTVAGSPGTLGGAAVWIRRTLCGGTSGQRPPDSERYGAAEWMQRLLETRVARSRFACFSTTEPSDFGVFEGMSEFARVFAACVECMWLRSCCVPATNSACKLETTDVEQARWVSKADLQKEKRVGHLLSPPHLQQQRKDTASSPSIASAAAASLWWTDLCGLVLKLRAGHEEQQQQQQQAAKKLLFHEFVLRYAIKHQLWDLRLGGARRSSEAEKKAIVLVDNRAGSPLGLLSVLMAALNLGAANDASWHVYVFCGDRNETYVRRCLEPHFENEVAERRRLHVVVVDELCAANDFHIEDYNRLMKAPTLWRRLDADACRKCVVVQDDGMLVRPGAERLFVEPYDYVGAPWREGQQALRRESNPDLVGNGGLSVRNVRAMVEIAEAGHDDHDCGEGVEGLDALQLSFNGVQTTPEDVFFSRGVYDRRDRYRMPTRREAAVFASEEDLTHHESLGFHKPWPYHSLEAVAAFFRAILLS